MSGIVGSGSIREASKEFNNLALNNTIKGIKTANYLEGKIKDAEEKQTTQVQEKPEEEIDPAKLAAEIQDDMTR